MGELTDQDLMLKYRQGEAQAMQELLRRYKNPVYHFALRLTSNAVEAEDIAQEVFLKVHEYRYQYRAIGKFSTWLFSIAHNLCVSRFRKNKWFCVWPHHKDDPEKLMDFESPDPSPKEIAQQNDTDRIVKDCIQGLPFLQKEALILREYQSMDYQDIAKVLRKSQATVKILIYRARQNLKDKLLPYIEEFKGGSHE